MRVIITGGSGLIGRALTNSLAKDGHEVIVLSRRPDGVRGLPPGARAVGWDGRTAAGWGDLVNGAGAVVNLAGAGLAGDASRPPAATGEGSDPPRRSLLDDVASLLVLFRSRWTARRRQMILQSRVDAGAAVVDAFRRAETPPPVLIQASAVGYYPTHEDDREFAEDAAPADNFLAEVCVQWERASEAVEELGVRRPIVRTSLVLSGDGGNLPLFALPTELFVGGPLGSGRQWVPWIHIDDEVRAIRFLIENEAATGPYNLVAPESLRFNEFGRILGRVLGRPFYLPLPGFVLRLALGELAMLVLEGQQAVPDRLREAGFTYRYGDLETALRQIYGRPA